MSPTMILPPSIYYFSLFITE